jgi:hypothetical protein
MTRPTCFALTIAAILLAGSALAQTAGPTSATPAEKPASPEVATCKAAALQTLSAREPEIKDIYVDEDGATIATAETKVEDTPVTRIIIAEAYLRTDKSDKPRRFLCLLGEKNKVLLTFFTAR